MGQLPLRPCSTPGCRALVRGQPRCPTHTTTAARGKSVERGYDRHWRTLRDLFIREHPMCACGKPSEVVHHVRPVNEAPYLRLDERNLVALCRKCHGITHGQLGTWSL